MVNVSMIRKLARFVPANFKVSMYMPTGLVKKNFVKRMKSCNDADVKNATACFIRMLENVKSPFVKLKVARKTGTQNSIYAMEMSAGRQTLVKGAYSHVDDVHKGRLSLGNGRVFQANGFVDEAAEAIQTEAPIPHINNNWTAMIIDGGTAGRLSCSGNNSSLMKPIIGNTLRSIYG